MHAISFELLFERLTQSSISSRVIRYYKFSINASIYFDEISPRRFAGRRKRKFTFRIVYINFHVTFLVKNALFRLALFEQVEVSHYFFLSKRAQAFLDPMRKEFDKTSFLLKEEMEQDMLVPVIGGPLNFISFLVCVLCESRPCSLLRSY